MITTSGKFVSKFGEGHLSNPRGICINHSNGRVFVSSSGNNCVAIFEADGTFVSCFGQENLNRPWGLAFESSGNLHVASTNTSKIVVFTYEGEYITAYKSGVNQPAGIAIDDEGNTFVAEEQTHQEQTRHSHGMGGGRHGHRRGIGFSRCRQQCLRTIVILNSQHQVIASWDAGRNATGVTVDKEGSNYVCDHSGCCVYKY